MEKYLSTIQKETIKRLYKQDSYLTILLSIEEIFSNINLYAYQNWYEGEILEGPNVDKFWVNLKLLFDYNEKPHIDGILLLKKHKILVKLLSADYLQPRKIKTPDDIDIKTKKPKMDKIKIWVVDIKIPRNLIRFDDTFNIDEEISDDVLTNLFTNNEEDVEKSGEDIDTILD